MGCVKQYQNGKGQILGQSHKVIKRMVCARATHPGTHTHARAHTRTSVCARAHSIGNN